MKNGLLVEKILFYFLLLISSGVLYVLMTKKNTFTPENALIILLSFFWILFEYKIMKRALKKAFHLTKGLFHLSSKGKLRKV